VLRVWAALKRSWRRHPGYWTCSLLFLLALALAIALPTVLIRPAVPPSPAFLFTPSVRAASNSSLDITAAVDRDASVSYLIIPRAGSNRRSLQAAASDALQAISGPELQAASRGWGLSALEVSNTQDGQSGGVCSRFAARLHFDQAAQLRQPAVLTLM